MCLVTSEDDNGCQWDENDGLWQNIKYTKHIIII